MSAPGCHAHLLTCTPPTSGFFLSHFRDVFYMDVCWILGDSDTVPESEDVMNANFHLLAIDVFDQSVVCLHLPIIHTRV